MNIFKRIKKNVSIAIGAASVFIGLGLYQWSELNYQKITQEVNHSIAGTAFTTDGGQLGPQRDYTNSLLKKYEVVDLFNAGDEKYSIGVLNISDFDEYIASVKDFIKGDMRFVGGNHTQYAFLNRDFLRRFVACQFDNTKKDKDCAEFFKAKRFAPDWFKYPNYFYGTIYTDACVLSLDSVVYDAKIFKADIRKDQEAFAKKFLKDERCIGKILVANAHYGIYSSDDEHGDMKTKSSWYQEMYAPILRNKVDYYINGHSHITSWERKEGRTQHITVGAWSKLSSCTRGLNSYCFERPGIVLVDSLLRFKLVME